MKIVACVPMKLNNRRLPGKNIKKFDNGQPLCYYILNTLKKVNQIDEIYVYCSNEEITHYIPQGIRYLKRDTTLDADTTKINEVLSCFARDVDADIYVMAHTTAPFISAKSIQIGLDKVLSGEFDSAFAAKSLQEFLWKDGVPFNYSLDAIPRTQDLPKLYAETSSFYIYNKETILKENRRIGNNPFIVEIGEIESTDIDEEENFIIANALFNFHYNGGKI